MLGLAPRNRFGSQFGALAVLLVGLIGSGCISSSATSSGKPSGSAAPDGPHGRIVDGTVVDAELRPLAGVEVSHLGGAQRSSSDDAGHFSIDGLPADPALLIQAQHPSYQTQTLRVDLQYTPRAEVRFVLQGGPAPDGYHTTNITKGLIQCQVAFGSHHGFPGYYRRSCAEVSPDTSQERVLVPIGPGVNVAMIELAWEPQSQAADIMGLTVYLSTPTETLLLGAQHNFAGGGHYVQIFTGSFPMEAARQTGGVLDSLVHVDPSAVDEHVPTNAGVVIQQPFTLYTTAFYGESPSPTWSAIPKA